MTETITEEPIAPIIDAEAAQNAAQAEPEPVKMIYDIDFAGDLVPSIGISAFVGRGMNVQPILLSARFDGGSSNYHLSLNDAKAMRDALTEAIKAWEAVVGAL